MSKKEMYEARTEELITPILDRRNFELVDVEYVKEGSTWYLRVYIDSILFRFLFADHMICRHIDSSDK